MPGTDVKTASVAVNPRASATTGQPFLVSAMANFHNNGPAPSILANVTFALTVPPDCIVLANNPIMVPDRILPASVVVGLNRSWSVSCTNVGAHEFAVNVGAVITPGQPWSEADLSNNAAFGTGTTNVFAPTPTPAP